MKKADVIIVHEFNGPKYFEAISSLYSERKIEALTFKESSVLKQLVRNVFRDKKSISSSVRRAFENFLLRLKVPLFKGKTVILAIPPWDFRMLWYGQLAKHNRLIYHTSWPNWQIDAVPRRYVFLNHILRWHWYRVLQLESVQIVAVASKAAEHLHQQFIETRIDVIPHVVSSEFDRVAATQSKTSFGILFVGELIEKKGVGLLPKLIEKLADQSFRFGIVGEGSLKSSFDRFQGFPNVTIYGKVSDRKQLAEIYASHHVLLVPSQKTSRWEELFGMVIVEAMSAGLPVIASKHIGPSSIITDEKDGFLVAEKQIEEFMERICYLKDNPVAWKAMSDSALVTAKRYSLKTVSAEWLELLTSTNSPNLIDVKDKNSSV